jgi:hypothetical protein
VATQQQRQQNMKVLQSLTMNQVHDMSAILQHYIFTKILPSNPFTVILISLQTVLCWCEIWSSLSSQPCNDGFMGFDFMWLDV